MHSLSHHFPSCGLRAGAGLFFLLAAGVSAATTAGADSVQKLGLGEKTGFFSFFRKLFSNNDPIMWVILAALLYGLYCIAERLLYLHRARVDTSELLRGLLNQLRNHNVKEAIVNCDPRTGPVGEIFRAAIEHWNDGEMGIRYAVEETVQLQLPKLEYHMKMLSVIGTFTPLLGLLGTLFALIRIFDMITENGGQFTGILTLSPFISRALICTASSLIVSVVCLAFHAFLVERIDRLLAEMGKGASEITYFLTTNPPPKE